MAAPLRKKETTKVQSFQSRFKLAIFITFLPCFLGVIVKIRHVPITCSPFVGSDDLVVNVYSTEVVNSIDLVLQCFLLTSVGLAQLKTAGGAAKSLWQIYGKSMELIEIYGTYWGNLWEIHVKCA